MKFFIDTEFTNFGPFQPINLLSIGIVAEDGREYYAESLMTENNYRHVPDWVQENVLPHLIHYQHRDKCSTGAELEGCPQKWIVDMRKDIREFIGNDRPTFHGYYSSFDYVCLSQIFGDFRQWPKGWPSFIFDIKQYAYYLNVRKKSNLPKQTGQAHNALEDARWNKVAWDYLEDMDARRK